MRSNAKAEFDRIRQRVRDHPFNRDRDRRILEALFHADDARALMLMGLLQRTAHLFGLLYSCSGDDLELSGSRWMLLLRLYMEEQHGNTASLTPTTLSHMRRLSRNAISSLLRGLEAQGLIERMVDPDDLRAFRIHLTHAGRAYVQESAPARLESLRDLLSGIKPQEQAHLVALLEKLHQSLLAQIGSEGDGVAPAAAPQDAS